MNTVRIQNNILEINTQGIRRGNADFILFNTAGRAVVIKKLNISADSYRRALKGIAPGVYIAGLLTEDGSFLDKIIIK